MQVGRWSTLVGAVDGDEPGERQRALAVLREPLQAVARWAAEHSESGALPPVSVSLGTARPVQAMDVAQAENGAVPLGQGRHGSAESRAQIRRCATGTRVAASGSTATSGRCCGSGTGGWGARRGGAWPPPQPSR
jgi:hypothetical protein